MFLLADILWKLRFQKFCEKLHDIEKKIIIVVDCEEKKKLHELNKDNYTKLLD